MGIVEKAARGAGKVLDKSINEERTEAEKSVKTEIQVDEENKVKPREFHSPDLDVLINEKIEDSETETELLIKRIENVAFKHHIYHVNDNYEPLFSGVIKKKNKDDGESVVSIEKTSYFQYVRGLFVKKFVFDKNEVQFDKMNNIFSAMCDLGMTVAMVIHKTTEDTSLLFLLKNNNNGTEKEIKNAIHTLEGLIKGNFPGSEVLVIDSGNEGVEPEIYKTIPELFQNTKEISNKNGYITKCKRGEIEKCTLSDIVDEIFSPDNAEAISVVTGIPSIKTKDSKYATQGIEKLIDAAKPSEEKENYTLILLAEPISPDAVSNIRNGYEEMATMLSPFKSTQYNLTKNITNTKTHSETENLAKNVGTATAASIGVGASAGIGATASMNEGDNFRIGDRNLLKKGKDAAKENIAGKEVKSLQGHQSGYNLGASANASISANVSMNKTINEGRTYTTGVNYGNSVTEGESVGETKTFTSLSIENIIERLKKEVKRLNDSESSGMWRFAGYVVSGDRAMAERVSHIYQGMIQGEGSAVERNSVNTWIYETVGSDENKRIPFNALLTSLINMEHPKFKLKSTEQNQPCLPEMIYCTTEINSAELALAMNMPQKSVVGLPVVTSTAFGRNISTLNGSNQIKEKCIQIGSLYHMLEKDESIPVMLEKDKLTSHIFVTGSTGTGKSNVIYKILEKATVEKASKNNEGKIISVDKVSDGVHFLVIEPAKGEYAKNLGGWNGVNVYSTNNMYGQLLKINPFSFPDKIHVLEHIDRLVEIFNACWPMYAAMPAILKDAVEQAYKEVGWNLIESTCSPKRFPTFRNLISILPKVIAKSGYSSDTNSDYVGALVTRVNSLTTGINGRIFNSINETPTSKLFEENTIVDLSRVASTETKSLLMGLMIMKQQEFWINKGGENEHLKHITVLEEAHNLLRKTSSEQSQESANLQGKSVEMIANAIAEMRTYGECYIIADQAPGLLDPCVIRNTNTKLVLRLPDEGDRKLAGSSIALKKEQIDELAKIPNWVAAVYQSDWLEPVLCLVDEFKSKIAYKNKEKETEPNLYAHMANVITKDSFKKGEIDAIKSLIKKAEIEQQTRLHIEKVIKNNEASLDDKRELAYDLFGGKLIGKQIYEICSAEKFVQEDIENYISILSSEYEINEELIRQIVLIILDYVKDSIELETENQIDEFERVESNVRLYLSGGVM